MKTSSIKFVILTGALLAVLIFLNWLGWLEAPKSVFLRIISPPGKIIRKIGQRISQSFYYLIFSNKIGEENERLFSQNLNLLQRIAELKELEKENEIFRKALIIAGDEKFELIPAKIIGLNFLNFDNIILIDKGEKDGIKENYAVMTKDKVLLGKITEVYGSSSKIIAVSSEFLSVAVISDLSRSQGIVSGRNTQNEFLMNSISKDAEINEGELVITSGLDAIFPKNLLIGTVKRIEEKDIELFKSAVIEPFVNFNDLEGVLVIKK